MSIEASTARTSSPSHKAGPADGRNHRSKNANGGVGGNGSASANGVGAGAAGDAAASGLGFLAILSSVGEVGAADTTPSDAPAMLATTDTGLPDPAALLVQSGLAVTPLDGAAKDGGTATAGTGTADGVAALGDDKGDKGRAARGALPGGADKWSQQGTEAQGKDALAKDLQGKDSSRGAGLKKQDKTPLLPDQASNTASVATQKLDPRDVKLQMAMEIHRAMQGGAELAQAVASTVGREEQRSAEKSIFSAKLQDSGVPVTTNGVEPSTSGPLDVPVPIAEAGAATDVQVAEQVQYWISKDIQNAELKLDGLGEKPVEVSISMQGNEAHVSFRTDEASARSALENAGNHLKDMLQREGLTLGGVFVGHSGGQGADREGDRRQRPGARQTQIAPAKLESVDNGRRAHGTTGRALDLFV